MKVKVRHMEEEKMMDEVEKPKRTSPELPLSTTSIGKPSRHSAIASDVLGRGEESRMGYDVDEPPVAKIKRRTPEEIAAVKADANARLINQYGEAKPLNAERAAKEAEIKARIGHMSDEEFDKYADEMIAMINAMPDEPEEQMEQSLAESKKTPYPVLFEQRERLLKEAYQTREERVYAELVRRFIKK